MNPSFAWKDVRLADLWIVRFLPALVGAVALMIAFSIGAHLLSKMVSRFGHRRALDEDLTNLLSRATRLSLLSFGAVTAIGTMGVDIKALVAGLGLTGFALGFALKDIISNTLAGVLILLYKPFHRGDHIEIAGTDGFVIGVDMRYTTLEGDDGSRVLIPNANLFTNGIKVRGRKPRSGA
jgi:small-conductance mechanosensitive channel